MAEHTSSKDPKVLQAEHTPEAIRHRVSAATEHSFVGDFVLGAVDGTVTTFAIVAGVAGALAYLIGAWLKGLVAG